MSKIYRVCIFYDHQNRDRHGDLPVIELARDKLLAPFRCSFIDESATYEEIVRIFTEDKALLPLPDPRLRYNLILQVFEEYQVIGNYHFQYRSLSKPVTLREGQTLVSTHITYLATDKAELERREEEKARFSQELARVTKKKADLRDAGLFDASRLLKFPEQPMPLSTRTLYCSASLEMHDAPLLKEKLGGTSPSLGETVNTILTSSEVGIINLTASVVTITTALIIIMKSWSKTHRASSAGVPQRFPQPGKTDIYAIRVRMTDGRERTMQQWLNEPDELKRFIDVFLQSSSQMKPTEVIFVLWNRDTIVVDVTQGTQANLQLNEMLKYLKIDSAEK